MANTLMYRSYWERRMSVVHAICRTEYDTYIEDRAERYAREDAEYRFKMRCIKIALVLLIVAAFIF